MNIHILRKSVLKILIDHISRYMAGLRTKTVKIVEISCLFISVSGRFDKPEKVPG